MKSRKLIRLVQGALILTLSLACVAQENIGDEYQKQAETHDLAAYDAFRKGWGHLLKKTPEDATKAIALFRKAVELDPNYSRAYAALAQAYWDNSRDAQFNKLTGEIQMASSVYANDTMAWEFLQKAGKQPLSQAYALKARMLQRQRRFDEAMRDARKAVAFGPNDPTAYDALIENLIYAGELEEAIRLIDKSIGLAPSLPGEKLFLKSMAYYMAERLTEALSTVKRARTYNPHQFRYAAIQAAILADLGRVAEAKVAFEEYRAGLINFERLNWTMFYWPFGDLKNAERLAKSLLKAGLVDSTHHYYAVSPEKRLQTEQIIVLLANRTMIGADYGPAGSWEEFQVGRDEDVQIVSQDILTYFRDGPTRVKNNLLCDPWYEFGEYCVAIYPNPDGTPEQKNEYIFFTLDGIFTFSVFDSAN